jgi:LysM repeat protein
MTDKKHPLGFPLQLSPSRFVLELLLVGIIAFWAHSEASAQTLRGSASSVDYQFRVAQDHNYTFIEYPVQVERFVRAGYLVPVKADRNFDLKGVSYPFVRPETRTFIQRLSDQYRRGCGEKLVITSLTRPLSRQPRNSSSKSVHPTGMALDIRRSNSRACRAWLEGVLLSLEKTGVLDATRESRPPHYHVALFPEPYARYVTNLSNRPNARVASVAAQAYEVRSGDSLWDIARSYGTTVDRLQAENDLRGSRIYAGQVIRIPTGR